MTKFPFLFCIALAACAADAAESQALNADNPLLKQMRSNMSSKDYIAQVLRPFDQRAGDSGELIATEIRARQAREAATLRATSIATILRYDLNADLRVSKAEVLEFTLGESSQRRTTNANETAEARAARETRQKKNATDQAEATFKRYDLNANGVVDIPEAAKASADQRVGPDDTYVTLLSTGLGRDGKLTRAEFKTYATSTFEAADKNKDGRLSQEEYTVVRDLTR